MAYYLDVLERTVRTQKYERQDWGRIWRVIAQVTSKEWQAIKTHVLESCDRVKNLFGDTTEWRSEQHSGGAIVAIVHTACDLAVIRQTLSIVQ